MPRHAAFKTELLSDMATVAANHYIGVLVIDEIQRLSLAKSGGADLLLNFFVQLVNDMVCPSCWWVHMGRWLFSAGNSVCCDVALAREI